MNIGYLTSRPLRWGWTAAASIIGTLMFLAACGLAAQTVPTSPPAQPTPSASPTARPATEAVAVERIIVTAEKREENVQEVPSSISVINDVELDNLHATQLTDYAPYVPGLQVTSGGSPGQATISLRGLAPLAQSASTGTYIDEIPVGSSGIYQDTSVFALDLLPYDIRRIEVLRGPQGTLYGANSLGGLLKYVTLEPNPQDNTFRFGGGIYGVEGSGDVGWDTHASGNIAFARNTAGLRLSYAQNELPGFIDNVQNGGKDINSATQQSALVALQWEPNDVISIKLTALGQRIESDNNNVVALNTQKSPIFGDLTNQLFFDEPFNKKIGLIAGTVNFNLGFADLLSVTSYSNTSADFRADTTLAFGGLPPLLGIDVPATSFFDKDFNLDKFIQEVRLTSKATGSFLWQLGAFYTYERAINRQLLALRQLNGAPFTGDLALLNTLVRAELPSRYTEYAAFANASYRFTDWFTLGAGLRFSRNEQSFAQNIPGGLLLPPGNTPGGSRENVFGYMVSPEFHLNKDVLLYGRVATGYQPGGPNVAVPGVPPSVDATTSTSYEAGLKSEFFDHRVLFNVAGYHIDLEDVQVLDSTAGGIQFFANGGKAQSNGVELTLGYQPIKALSFAVNGAYTDAFLSEDSPLLGGFAGDPLPFIPKFSASATIDYFFALPFFSHRVTEQQQQVSGYSKEGGKNVKDSAISAVPGERTPAGNWNGHVGLGVRWVDSAPVGVGPDPFRTDRYAALDLNADISNDHWTIRAYFRNLTDERAYAQIVPVADLTGTTIRLNGLPIQPRTIGIEIDYRF